MKPMNFSKSQFKNYFLKCKPTSHLNPEKRLFFIATLLASVFLVVTQINSHLISPKGNSIAANPGLQGSRTIASHRPTAQSKTFENSVVKRFTQNLRPAPIHIAQRPTQMENLIFGKLAGSYLVEIQSGKIAAIHLRPKNHLDFNPQKFKSAATFLLEHKNLFTVDFDKIFKLLEHRSSELNQEEFDLLNTQNQRVGIAIFTFDKSGHLVSLKIDRAHTLAAF